MFSKIRIQLLRDQSHFGVVCRVSGRTFEESTFRKAFSEDREHSRDARVFDKLILLPEQKADYPSIGTVADNCIKLSAAACEYREPAGVPARIIAERRVGEARIF
jgi:hypothetical protein